MPSLPHLQAPGATRLRFTVQRLLQTLCAGIALAIALLPPVVATARAGSDADLIGYGRIRMSASSEGGSEGVTTFVCESDGHADRLLSKLRADFTWDKQLGIRSVTLRNGAPALALEGCGVMLLARKGNTVFAVSGASPESVEALLKKHALDGSDMRHTPAKPHPMSLDFFDLRPISFYYHALNVLDLAKSLKRYDREVLSRAADFWGRSGFGYSMFNPFFGLDNLVDGPAHLFPLTYSVEQAKAHGAIFMTHLGHYEAPWWMRNRFPRDIVQWDPLAISGWGPLGAMAGTHLSQSASPEAYACAQRFTGQAIEHLKNVAGDNLGCVRVVGGGHPGDEMGLHHLSTEFMDYDEAGQAGFRRWLRETRQFDLAALGLRWFGDARHFKSWAEVRIPSHFEFFGGFGNGTLDLCEHWLWRPDSAHAEPEGWGRSDYQAGVDWTPTDLVPSVKQLFLFGSERDKTLREGRSTAAWFRKEFDASAWLEKNNGRKVFLVAQVNDEQVKPVEVFLNDAYLGLIKPKTVRVGPIAFDATALVKSGRNTLCLKVRSGVIRGPVFLTTEEPRRYPYLDRCGNARWVDLRDWTNEKLSRGWLREARFARERLPEIPMMFVPGSWRGFSDQFLGLKREAGIASIHNTGSECTFNPWWAGIGYVWGSYMSSEESATVSDPKSLSRELAWMLLNGHGHHNYYYDAVHGMKIEQATGWFTKNARLLELFAKANWQKPSVAVLHAAGNDRYFPYSTTVDDFDIGQQALPAAHFNNVYVTEAELKAGLTKEYPVVFDAGTPVMDDPLAAAIERYVRDGGTFVAVSATGRHSLLEADAWPIAKLAGLKLLGERDNAKVAIPAGNTLLKRLAGRTFNGSGLAFDPANVAPEHVLARWEDGAIAAAVRPLGRGRLVLLGSSFWHSASDRTADGVALAGSIQTLFLTDLFASAGVSKEADMDGDDIWLRRFVTKNGLQDWLMAYNDGRGPARDLTLTFPLARRPGRVLDMVTGESLKFTFENGAVRVPGLGLDPSQIRIIGVERGSFPGAMDHWFAEKQRYESRPAPATKSRPLPSPAARDVVFETFRFRQAAPAATNDLAWLAEPTGGPAWKTVGCGFWDEMGFAAQGIGLYRQTFRAPESWRGRRVLLAFASFDYPVFLEQAAVYLNGRRAGDYRAHAWANFDVLDISPLLKRGENSLAVLVQASEVRGGYIGQLAAFALENLEDAHELRTDWKLFSDNRTFATTGLPLEKQGRHIETDFAMPAAWKNKDVFLEFEVSDRWVGLVVINGRPIAFNQSLHPYANIMQVNLHPWARPGEINRIELWPRTPEETTRLKMTVKSVRIGAVSRK